MKWNPCEYPWQYFWSWESEISSKEMCSIYDSIKECGTNPSTFILISGNELNSLRASVRVFPVITHNAFKKRKSKEYGRKHWGMWNQSLYFYSMLWKWNCTYFLGHIKSLYFRTIFCRWDWFHVSISDRKWNVHNSIPTDETTVKKNLSTFILLSGNEIESL